jgi:glycosyltransferase involved in cell wall biosynthesis
MLIDAHLKGITTAVIIPCYLVQNHIESVIDSIPAYITYIIVIDDASPDNTGVLINTRAQADSRIIVIQNPKNLGVGGSMKRGFRKALELDVKIIIKVDGDGQMDTAYLPGLLFPLLQGQADYTKGNRFRDFRAIHRMPLTRRLGNVGLSFLCKTATGYWNIFDPTNGFFAIRSEMLAMLPIDELADSYFFETSMLANLYLFDAVIVDVPMPARYFGEKSNLSIRKTLIEFPTQLLKIFLKRLLLKYFVYDFHMGSIYLLVSSPLLFFGLGFGINKWIYYASQGIPAPTGTVMVPTVSVLLGIQFLLAAIEIDIRAIPRQPISPPLLYDINKPAIYPNRFDTQKFD